MTDDPLATPAEAEFEFRGTADEAQQPERGKPPAARAWPAISGYLDECHAQIIELTKDRDRLARKLDATVRVRNDAIEALDTMQIDRDRLRTRLDEYRDSRERWMKSAYADRHDSLAAHAAIDRVRALHVYNEDADYCNVCADGGDIRWPCATIAALDSAKEA